MYLRLPLARCPKTGGLAPAAMIGRHVKQIVTKLPRQAWYRRPRPLIFIYAILYMLSFIKRAFPRISCPPLSAAKLRASDFLQFRCSWRGWQLSAWRTHGGPNTNDDYRPTETEARRLVCARPWLGATPRSRPARPIPNKGASLPPGGPPRLVQALMADMRGNGAAAPNRGDLS